jgi:hypothetical protein
VVNGYFAARFNAGYVTWAFFHLVPCMMWLHERSAASELAGVRRPGLLAAIALVGFLFFTGALPHALMHFYPAFMLLVVFRLAAGVRAAGWARALSASLLPLTAHALGLWLAAYKLYPVIRWQQVFPRRDVRPEGNALLEVLGSTLAFVNDYRGPVIHEAWHIHPSWEYNAYIGAGAWLLAAAAGVYTFRRRTFPPPPASDADAGGPAPGVGRLPDSPDPRLPGVFGYGAILVAAGVALSLGSAHPFGPAQLFPHLPMLDGIRAFARYQILTLFGLAVLGAIGMRGALLLMQGRRGARAGALVTALAVLVPPFAQAAALVWNLPATPNREIAALYELGPPPAAPLYVGVESSWGFRTDHETALLQRGYWIANCFEALTTPEPKLQILPRAITVISIPPPTRLERITYDSLTLAYPPKLERDVFLVVPTLPWFRYSDAPIGKWEGRQVFARSDLAGSEFTITADYPGPARGAAASAAGLLATGAFLLAVSRRRTSRGNGKDA